MRGALMTAISKGCGRPHLPHRDGRAITRLATPAKGPGMELEVTLEREHPDLHAGSIGGTSIAGEGYQPRVCIRSAAAIFDVSSPGIASPRSSLTRASTSGSL